jgi:hypothetical protein
MNSKETLLEVDNRTLEDLEILPGKGSYCLLNLLDSRAKTTDAKLVLKKIVLSR